jgi:3-hydroxyisobutyrate dehydrogenase
MAGIGYVDAPVSGGQAGAENGQLSVMCGGAQADFDRAAPVIDAYAKICRLMGDIGAGQMTKMCNQIAIAGLVQGLSESLAFAQKAGLNIADVVQVISQGAAGSWQMVNRHKTMAEGHFEHGFAVDWMRKDLAICLATGDQINASLPVTALVDQFYKDVQKMGGGRWDTSALIARLT